MPMFLAALILAVTAAAPLAADQSAPSTTTTRSANDILDRALQVWRDRTYPPYMRYLIDVRAHVKGRLYAEGFQAWVRTMDDFVITTQAPLYSSNQMSNPYGTKFQIFTWTIDPSTGVNTPFGVPRISPYYSFGFVPQSAVDFHPHPVPGSTSDASVLGTVTVTARYYNATLVGEEQCDTGPCWHLALEPVEDPGEYRVRAMWVDEDTFQPARLTVAGIFNGCAASKVQWDVRYMNFHGQWVLREETTSEDVRDGGGLFGWGAATFHGLTYTLGHYHFLDQFDDFEFFDRGSTQATQE
ncbi:MAG TPA: hypothetical protein VII69_12215 [Candidatus Eremiobacteraceae bacterium]